MSRALKDGAEALKSWVTASVSRVTKIAAGGGTPGTRAAPAKMAANDAKIGVRLDNGELVTKDGKMYRRYKLQANKNASNPTIKDLAAQNSHRVFAEADVPIDDSKSKEEKIDKLFDDLYDDIDKRMMG